MSVDLIVRGATLPDGRSGMDIAISGGRITAVEPGLEADAGEEIDAAGCLVTPPFVDSHFHMDATLSFGRPRVNESGTLLEGIRIWSELKPELTAEDIRDRALRLCQWAIARGTLAIRSHVDICDERLLAVDALLDVRETMKPWLDIQLVAFPQDGFLRFPGAPALLECALDRGVDVVGGIPHFERTMADGTNSVRALCEIAAGRGLPVDMHCDETDDPNSRHIEALAHEARRLGLGGRVTGSHLTSMHSMNNAYVDKLLGLMAEAGLHAVANPLINITLQGRFDSYPRRRGMTRVPELMDKGINTAFGHDCVMDPWYSLGSHDMLQVAHMGLHVAQMTGTNAMRRAFAAVTENGARVLGLDGYGLAPGCHADLVVLQAGDPIEALRLSPPRLFVIRRGRIIADTPPQVTRVTLGDRTTPVDFRLPPPQ